MMITTIAQECFKRDDFGQNECNNSFNWNGYNQRQENEKGEKYLHLNACKREREREISFLPFT